MSQISAENKEVTNLVLLKNTPFLTSSELTTLFVVAPLDGVAHRRHAVWLCDCGFRSVDKKKRKLFKSEGTVSQTVKKESKVQVRRVV